MEYVNQDNLDLDEFNSRTKQKYIKEPINVFWCPKCRFIYIGLPDCHLAFIDANNLEKIRADFNRPAEFKCSGCDFIFPDVFLVSDQGYKFRVPIEEVRKSSWVWIIKKRKDFEARPIIRHKRH